MCILCQQTSPKRWFGNRTITSFCDVTNSAHQIQMTTLCRWMKPPHEKFLRTPLDVSVESFTQAVYLNCNFAKWLLKYAITYYAFVLKNRHSGKVKSDNVDKAKIQNSYEKKESVSPTNTQSNVWVNDRIESYLVRISKTVKDLNLCIIGKFMLFDTKVIIFM